MIFTMVMVMVMIMILVIIIIIIIMIRRRRRRQTINVLRPIFVGRFWISEGSTQTES